MKRLLPTILTLLVGCSPKTQATIPLPSANNFVDVANDGTNFLRYNPTLVRRNGNKITTWILSERVEGSTLTPSWMLYQDVDCISQIGTLAVIVDEFNRIGQPNLTIDLRTQPLYYQQAFSTICKL